MTIPNGYDPITLNHWLCYKYQCHEGSANEFQRLFENIFKRAKPEFMQIRPYGKIGDRKCDGLFFSKDNSTVFQVYSPDELKQAEVQKKIDEDLDGAVKHWGDELKKWVFVYNFLYALYFVVNKEYEWLRKSLLQRRGMSKKGE